MFAAQSPITGRLYAATIFLSAALLFSVQPMIAKLALPLLGGTPAVWAVSMCVFQGLLLAGYCYAHLISTRLQLRTGAIVHGVVLSSGLLMLPITLRTATGSAPEGGYYLWLIGTLSLSIGLPFFALSANAPLLQKWYSELGRSDSANPLSSVCGEQRRQPDLAPRLSAADRTVDVFAPHSASRG